MTHVLIVTLDVLGPKMAGPAIRAWELSRQLADTCTVTLASSQPVNREATGFSVVGFENDAAQLYALAARADVLLVQGMALHDFPKLAKLGKRLVIDLYDPLVFENLPNFLAQGPAGDEACRQLIGIEDAQLAQGDFFLCASERQRDMWLGRLMGAGRVTPKEFEADPALTRLIGVVPFGLQDTPPAPHAPVLRGVVPGIGPDDTVLLWGGGVWDWFDPLTLIRAVGQLSQTRSDIKLYFLGVAHPNPAIAPMAMTHRAMTLAQELGLTDRHVFFNTGWVPYDQRAAYLTEASAGVSAHFDSVETRFSFRTRVLDYLWAGLPVLTTVGDSMAELVEREGLGASLNYGDVDGWARAIARLADDRPFAEAARAQSRAVAQRFRWSQAAQPLIDYCRNPYPTAPGLTPYVVLPRPIAMVRKGFVVLLQEGPLGVWKKVALKLRARAAT